MIGHALAELFGAELDEAFDKCDQLSNQDGDYECGRGVVMEYLSKTPYDEFTIDLSVDGLLGFCSQFKDPYRASCYQDLGRNAYDLLNGFDDAFKVCLNEPEIDRPFCFKNLGARMALDSFWSSQKVVEACKEMGNEWEDDCILGAVETSITEDKNAALANELCDMVWDREKCKQHLNEVYVWTYGEERF
jgi:hypothetical protein